MNGLNHFQYYFIPVTNQTLIKEQIQCILREFIDLPENVAEYDIDEQIIKFKFDGQQYITLYDYFQLLKAQKMPLSFQIIIEITIKIFNSLLQYNEKKLKVDLSLENIWIFFGKASTVNEQIYNLKVYLIQAYCFEAQEKKIDIEQQYEFRKKIKQEIAHFNFQNNMKELCDQFILAINQPNIQSVTTQLLKINSQSQDIQLLSFEKEVIYLNTKLYPIFSYLTKLGHIFKDNLINWIIKDINLQFVLEIQDIFQILNFLRLQEIAILFLYLKDNQMKTDENLVVVYLCKGKFLNSLEDLKKFKFNDLKLHLDSQNNTEHSNKVNNQLLYFQKYYPKFSQKLQQQSTDYLENLKQISDKTIEIINQKIDSRIKELFTNITKLYKMTQEQFDKWFDQKLKNLVFEQIMKSIEENLLNKQIQFEKLHAEEDLINNFIEQSIEDITMQLIMEKNKVIVENLQYQEHQNKMEMDQF